MWSKVTPWEGQEAGAIRPPTPPGHQFRDVPRSVNPLALLACPAYMPVLWWSEKVLWQRELEYQATCHTDPPPFTCQSFMNSSHPPDKHQPFYVPIRKHQHVHMPAHSGDAILHHLVRALVYTESGNQEICQAPVNTGDNFS